VWGAAAITTTAIVTTTTIIGSLVEMASWLGMQGG
jgi:hypothetical protein